MVTMPNFPSSQLVTPAKLFRTSLFASKRGLLLALGTAGLVGHQIAESLVPVLIGVIVDKAIIPGDAKALALWTGVMAAVFLLLAFSWRLGMRATMKVYAYGTHDLRQMVIARTLHSHGMRRRRATGEVLSIASSDTDRTGGIAWLIAGAGGSVAAVVSAAVALLAISAPLGLAVLVASPAILFLMHLLSKPLERRTSKEQSTAARASALATDLLTGLRTIKGLGAEATASKRYQESSQATLSATISAVWSKASYQATSTAMSGAFLAATALAAALMALHGQISVGELVTVVGLAQFVQGPMEQLGYFGVELARKRASAKRIATYLGEEAALPSSVGGASGGGASVGSASVQSAVSAQTPLVSFTGAWGIPAFECARGQVVGVSAEDSEAARTLVDVLGLRVPVPVGVLKLQGQDASQMDPTGARELCYADGHGAPLFSGSLRENVYGAVKEQGLARDLGAESTSASVMVAASAEDIVDGLEDGLDSYLQGHADRLSGGQRQRIVLARTLAQTQAILVLHEPTSNVDAVTESRIARSLGNFSDKAIVLVTTSPVLLEACTSVVRAKTSIEVNS